MAQKRIAIVTGASSGMGREFVRQIDRHTRTIDEIWAVARRRERLEELEKEIKNCSMRIFSLDICKENQLDCLEEALIQANPGVRILVNAAGVGTAGAFDGMTRQDALRMVELNDMALVAVTHMVLPYMTNPGHIIQMASASAFLPQKEFAVYAASKAFVLSFSRALNGELKGKGVRITAVCPGPVDTEFLDICNQGMKPKPLKRLVMAKPAPVVAKALRDAKEGREISIYGLPMKGVYAAARLLPQSLLLKLM